MVAYRAKFGSSASNGVSVRPEWIKISAQRPAPWVDGGIDSYKPVAVLAIKTWLFLLPNSYGPLVYSSLTRPPRIVSHRQTIAHKSEKSSLLEGR